MRLLNKTEVMRVCMTVVYGGLTLIMTLTLLPRVVYKTLQGTHDWLQMGLAVFLAVTGLWSVTYAMRKMEGTP